MQRRKVRDALQSCQLCIVHHACRIGDVAAMDEAMSDEVGCTPTQFTHQLIVCTCVVAQMPIAKISPCAVRFEQAGFDG